MADAPVPAITREEIERVRTGYTGLAGIRAVCDLAASALSHPAALERARAEGVMAAYNAVAAIKHVDEGHARGLEDAEASIRALGPRPSPEAEAAPGHTDLMVSPEAIDEFLAANPLPDEPATHPKDMDTCRP